MTPKNSTIGAISSKKKLYGNTTMPTLPYFGLKSIFLCAIINCIRPLPHLVLWRMNTFKDVGPSVQQSVTGI